MLFCIPGITIDEDVDKQKTLAKLGVMNDTVSRIRTFFQIHYSTMFEEREILALTVNALVSIISFNQEQDFYEILSFIVQNTKNTLLLCPHRGKKLTL